ncbi:MAG: A/G-specific adenine glycosylase [Lentisphaeria bacterium]|nr:A/G-specific adenine glycosylase [Lentisphaeria bacterium]
MEQLLETALLLAWYDENGRVLPWRVRGGAHPDPYAVWVSEIMLQQTTVKTVIPYFERWMKRFPDLRTLAAAPLDDVLLLWQGLGYYTRAKKMHQCAGVVAEKFAARFPADREELLKLPGIGPYTASSLCAFGFNMPETVIDGNVMRVLARRYGIEGEVTREKIAPFAGILTPADRSADYASAIMDLGATVCTPQAPACDRCPWAAKCIARERHLTERIPQLKKSQKKKKQGGVFILLSPDGKLFIRKRGGRGLLSGLWELPWNEEGVFPFETKWEEMKLSVRHIFTHMDLELKFFKAVPPFPEAFTAHGVWITPGETELYAFSTLMKKVLKKLLQSSGSGMKCGREISSFTE